MATTAEQWDSLFNLTIQTMAKNGGFDKSPFGTPDFAKKAWQDIDPEAAQYIPDPRPALPEWGLCAILAAWKAKHRPPSEREAGYDPGQWFKLDYSELITD